MHEISSWSPGGKPHYTSTMYDIMNWMLEWLAKAEDFEKSYMLQGLSSVANGKQGKEQGGYVTQTV